VQTKLQNREVSQESALFYESAFHSSNDLLITVDANTYAITDCNSAMVETLGYSNRAQIIGKQMIELYHPSASYRFDAEMQQLTSEGIIDNILTLLKTANDNFFCAIFSATLSQGIGQDAGQINGCWTEMKNTN